MLNTYFPHCIYQGLRSRGGRDVLFGPRISRDEHHWAVNTHCMHSFILEAGGRSRAEKEIPNMDKSSSYHCMKTVIHRKTETFGNMKTLNMRLRQYMVYLCFSSHLQVINKVYEQCSANLHSIYYSIIIIIIIHIALFLLFLSTQSALHREGRGGEGGGGISSSTTSVQHPPGWCDGSHSAPDRSPHTSLLVERRQSDEANQCMGMIRRPWWSEANGQIWPGCQGHTSTLFRRTSWDF